MSITFDQKTCTFKLDTAHSSYMFQVLDGGYLCHLYWGGRIDAASLPFLSREYAGPYVRDAREMEERPYPLNTLPQEFPCEGVTDFRVSAARVTAENGTSATDFRYRSHAVTRGKPPIDGLPATYADGEEAETLAVTLYDDQTGAEAVLWYTAFKGLDAITRRVTVTNRGAAPCTVKRLFSASLDFFQGPLDLVQLYGGGADERHVERRPLSRAVTSIQSGRGISSHEHNPFIALCAHDATEYSGEVYGFNLVYSGSFAAVAEVDNQPSVRVLMGLNPENFSWRLEPGERFETPEAVLVYSGEGFSAMSHTYHDLYRNHLCRGQWKNKPRPVLINNWEATYFDFNREKLLALAKEAAEAGIELFVLDDGWFGHRDADDCSLGDWVVNTEKLGGSLSDLAEDIHRLGMQFGLWFEPEMISPDSDLYRAHPDWCLHCGERMRSTLRHQLVLDMSREDVVNYVIQAVSDILSSCPIDYVKWDMNRSLSEVGSALLPPERQGETHHRYMLGVYRAMEVITSRFPHILFEGCAGGGGRFDPGILYYMPQIWTSDNTDAVERLKIQYGTSLAYPLSCMSAHVSTCPNHQVGRTTPLATRFHAALTGSFGYELDLCSMSPEEKEAVKAQIVEYHRYQEILTKGRFYRLLDPADNAYCAWMTVGKGCGEALVCYFKILSDNKRLPLSLRLRGLDPERRYRDSRTGEIYSGVTLMNAGLPLPCLWGDFLSHIVHLTPVREEEK